MMAVEPYIVRATNFHCYITDLLQNIYEHGGFNDTYVSLRSGHLTLSVAPYILSSISPMLKSVLLEDSTHRTIILHASYMKVLPCLVTLLYTGQVSNIPNDQVVLLKLLTEELGITVNKEVSCERDIENKERLGSSLTVNQVVDREIAATPLPIDGLNNNLNKSVEFVPNFSFPKLHEEADSTSMCPPLNPEANNVPGIRNPAATEILRNNGGHNSAINDRDVVDVITVLDHEVDEIVESVGGAMSDKISTYIVKDTINVDNPQRCNICDRKFDKKHDLICHLATTHYKSRLADGYAEFGRICPLCEEFSNNHEDNLNHIGIDHEVVNEYYKADKFADFNSNLDESTKQDKEIFKNIQQKENKSRGIMIKDSASSSSTIKGILKLTQASPKPVPKSILRATRPKSPSTKESILKLPTSKMPQSNDKVKFGTTASSQRKVLLSIQDDCGDTLVDME